MKKEPDKYPQFADEEAERKFWEASDSVPSVEWSKAETVHLPNLKPSPKKSS